MDETLTDRDQEERLRMFLRENWRWMFAGVVLGIGLLIGWHQYQAHVRRAHESAYSVYEDLLKVLETGDHTQAKTLVDELATEHRRAPYADQGRLLLAKLHVEQGRLDHAADMLRPVAEKSKDKQLAELARVRLARVLLASGKHTEALDALKLPQNSAYEPLAHEVRGDVYFAQGKTAEARAEYAAALAGELALIDRSLLELKLQQVGGKAAAEQPKVAP
jgi:predicted negative regulator of RcsB-dependent stress response